jgi:hypothetical protein
VETEADGPVFWAVHAEHALLFKNQSWMTWGLTKPTHLDNEAIEEFHLEPIDWSFQGGRNWKGKD